MMLLKRSAFLFFLVFSLLPVYSKSPIQVQIISDQTHIEPGKPFLLGIYFTMDPGWHIYWKNPGSIGLPTSAKLEVPEGFSQGPVEWPTPSIFINQDQISYGYERELLLITCITPPETIKDTTITIDAFIEWLACKEICLPGSCTIQTKLDVLQTPAKKTKWSLLFETTRLRFPYKDALWDIKASQEKDCIYLDLYPKAEDMPKLSQVYFFEENAIILPEAKQILSPIKDGYRLALKSSLQELPASLLQGVLYTPKGWSQGVGIRIDVPLEQKMPSYPLEVMKDPLPKQEATPPSFDLPKQEPNLQLRAQLQSPIIPSKFSLPIVLLFAFLGGLIVNCMPCVFPILGIKILSFAGQAQVDTFASKVHSMVFSMGVIVSFWILSFIIFLVKAAGESIGWGFQLQSPVFVFILICIFFLIALNYLGVFEVGTSLINTGHKWQNHNGIKYAFGSGVLTTIVASPCTGPFMGTAVGVALSGPIYYNFLIFTFLGLGVVTPYLIFAFSPFLLKMLPKPGEWMVTLKEAMAFPILATVLWLLWILSKQTNAQVLVHTSFCLLLIAFGAWVYGKWFLAGNYIKRYAVLFIFLGLIGLSIILGIKAITESEQKNLNIAPTIQASWELYTEEKLAKALAQNKPVFIDFTASWCLTCQINKENVLDRQDVIQAFKDANILLLRADWTKQDPLISKKLDSFNRSGVPFNVLYTLKKEKPLIIFPALLTVNNLLEAIDYVNSK